eukprot:gnl/Hemi2/17615_TR5814_c0_g1_i1.p1 gnl/Hemi2/17615_TR5814_c0_g1~~gnl/Hemi2/17615_TR5814_c0_g1_i1.p1  ORF type:complete len:370 (-),score=13.01 gnl/Hemi2/17615_TR5814_c0_g1_i1:353-1462(-)
MDAERQLAEFDYYGVPPPSCAAAEPPLPGALITSKRYERHLRLFDLHGDQHRDGCEADIFACTQLQPGSALVVGFEDRGRLECWDLLSGRLEGFSSMRPQDERGQWKRMRVQGDVIVAQRYFDSVVPMVAPAAPLTVPPAVIVSHIEQESSGLTFTETSRFSLEDRVNEFAILRGSTCARGTIAVRMASFSTLISLIHFDGADSGSRLGSPEYVQRLSAPPESSGWHDLYSAGWSCLPDLQRVVVRAWDCSTGQLAVSMKLDTPSTPMCGIAMTVDTCPGGRLAFCSEAYSCVLLWDPRSAASQTILDLAPYHQEHTDVCSFTERLALDGPILATSGSCGAGVFDLRNPSEPLHRALEADTTILGLVRL